MGTVGQQGKDVQITTPAQTNIAWYDFLGKQLSRYKNIESGTSTRRHKQHQHEQTLPSITFQGKKKIMLQIIYKCYRLSLPFFV
jgi:hypothetical protein